MENTEQERFLNDFDIVRIHVQLKQSHVDYLKTIDQDNQSKALRVVIENQMKQTRRELFERSILYIILLLCFAMFGMIILTMF